MSDYSLIQRGVVTMAVGEVSPKDVVLVTAVKLTSAKVEISLAEARFPDPVLDLDYRGVTARLLNSTTLRFEWKGTLATDPATGGSESIAVAWEVFDIENMGDDVKETLFRLQRILGYLGENCVQDLITYDDAGNMTQYRLRSFASKSTAEAATIDLPQGQALETGELSRVLITQDLEIAKNDRLSLVKVITDILATPGVN